jgi:hypothetical protein
LGSEVKKKKKEREKGNQEPWVLSPLRGPLRSPNHGAEI